MEVLSVHIDSPDKVIWEGEARSVSSANTEGPFDILPRHANFISLIEDQSIIIRTTKGEKLKFDLPRSVIFNHDNTVAIYTHFT